MDTYVKLDAVVRMMDILDPNPSKWFHDDGTTLYKKLEKLALELADKCLEEVNPKTASRQPTHSS